MGMEGLSRCQKMARRLELVGLHTSGLSVGQNMLMIWAKIGVRKWANIGAAVVVEIRRTEVSMLRTNVDAAAVVKFLCT